MGRKVKTEMDGRVREGASDFYRQGRTRIARRTAKRVPATEDTPENGVAKAIVNVAFEVHTAPGPGLLESVYEIVMAHELRALGFAVDRQVPISIKYKGMVFEKASVADLIVDDMVIVESKSVDCLLPVHAKQVLTHLKLTQKRLGLLINFGAIHLKDNIRRLAHGLEVPTQSPFPPSLGTL